MIEVVPATPADLETVAALEPDGFPGSERWSAQAWADELATADRVVLAAREDDHVVGAITVQVVEEVSDLLRVLVDPAARRRGIGTALIAGGVRAARERGARQMTLEVRWDNDAAIACYQRFGFEQLGCRAGYYGPGKDALILKLYDLTDPWPRVMPRVPGASAEHAHVVVRLPGETDQHDDAHHQDGTAHE